MSHALILGGSGFLGSEIARRFIEGGDSVTVVDGCLPDTGGSLANLELPRERLQVMHQRIEAIANLPELIRATDVIVDCMGWTRHRLALRDPLYDLELNVVSHLRWLCCVPDAPHARVIYLGSRGQYGNPPVPEIDEVTAMLPEDVQGVHKVAAENHFRVYSKLHRVGAVSLRLPNCFGPRQPTVGEDIGLVGGFVRDIIHGKVVEVFGHHRKRSLLFVKDLAEIVWRLSRVELVGFDAFNVAGQTVELGELVEVLCELVGGGGGHVDRDMPAEIAAIDVGNAPMSESKLGSRLGEIPRTDLRVALEATVEYFRSALS